MKVMRGVIGAVVFVMLMVILTMQPARAGDVQWNLQLHWQMPVRVSLSRNKNLAGVSSPQHALPPTTV